MALSKRLDQPGDPTLSLVESQARALDRVRGRLRDGTYRLEPLACFCGAEDGTEIAGRDGFGLPFRTVLCSRCGLVRTSPGLSSDSLARFLDEDQGPLLLPQLDDDALFAAQVEQGQALHRALVELEMPLRLVAEVACGTGGVLLPFREAGARVVGSDPRAALVRKGVAHGLPLMVGGPDVLRSELPDGADVVLLLGALESVPDLRRTLAQIVELLRPGGFVVASVAGLSQIEERHGHDLLAYLRPGQSFYFCGGTLHYVLEASGLEVLRSDEQCMAIARRRPEAAPHAEQSARIRAFLMQNEQQVSSEPIEETRAPAVAIEEPKKPIVDPSPSANLFFCVGSPKTGSTILSRLIDQHPRIACMSESYAFEPASASSVMNPRSEKWQIHGFQREQVERWFRTWAAQRGTRREILTRGFRLTMGEALEDFRARMKADAVGDRWPFYYRYFEMLLDVYPDAKFIFNVRDPRGVWNSGETFKNRGHGDTWLRATLDAEAVIAPHLHRPNFLTVRYEDMICEPEETMRRLYEFLGFDFRAEYLAYDPAKDPFPTRWEWIPQAKGGLDAVQTNKWREQMDPAQIGKINALSAPFLEKYGYAA